MIRSYEGPFTRNVLWVGSYRIRYAVAGEGPPVVLVHGLGASSRYMLPLAARLRSDFRVFVPELPGYGGSSKPAVALDVADLADVLRRWIRAVGIRRPALIGNSLGCQIIVRLLEESPGAAACAVLNGPTVDPEARSLGRQIARLLRDAWYERRSEIPIMVRDYLRAGPIRVLRTLQLMLEDEIERVLPLIGTPMMVVAGSRDPIVPEKWAREVARRLPNGCHRLIPGAPHTANYSAPLELTRIVRPFLYRHLRHSSGDRSGSGIPTSITSNDRFRRRRMIKKLKDQVIVITGASSGIGRATALRFAEEGATVVLAARREDALQRLAGEVRRRGGRALVVPADVSHEDQVQRIGQRAIAHFGRIDVWFNNAAVSLFCRIEDVSTDDFQRVLDTNVMGTLHGMRTAMRYFREQNHGILINTSSIVSTASQPYTSAYVASKASIRRMSESLRMELILDGAKHIHVCTVMPATVDTPFFQHAANYTGRAVKALPPVMSVDRVARAVVALAKHPRPEVTIGNAGRMMMLQRLLSTSLFEAMMARQVDRQHLKDRHAPHTAGNLYEPMEEGSEASGGWKRNGKAGRLALAALLLAVPAGALMLMRQEE